MDREQVLKTIEDAYRERAADNVSAVAGLWADDAHFALVGDMSLIPKLSGALGSPVKVNERLMELFTFHGLERLDAVVEGNRAVIRWKASIAPRGGDPVTTELCDIWTLTNDGKIKSLAQFSDTALIQKLLA